MDMMVDILKQLGADGSLLHQLIIVIVMYFLTKFLFLNHLQAILDNREDKTVNLEGSADKQFDEIEKIQKEYKEKIQKVNKEIKADSDSRKTEIARREESKYREQEKEVNTFVEESRTKIEAEINEKKAQILSEAQQLAGNLVDKVTKGL